MTFEKKMSLANILIYKDIDELHIHNDRSSDLYVPPAFKIKITICIDIFVLCNAL